MNRTYWNIRARTDRIYFQIGVKKLLRAQETVLSAELLKGQRRKCFPIIKINTKLEDTFFCSHIPDRRLADQSVRYIRGA